jgi:hypothetical protein
MHSIEDGNQVDSVYKDFSKVFDRVRHQLLLNEISVGIEPVNCIWLRSYLSGRIQKMRIGSAVSKNIKVTSVAPQGPLIQSSGTTWLHLVSYADDLKLFVPVSGFQDCLKIQSDLNKLSEWCDRKSILLNVGKCKTIIFARSRHTVEFSYMLGETVLDRVSSIKDLGVTMNEKMTVSEHVDVMVGKAFAMLGFIRRLSLELRDPYSLKSLSTSLVRPKLQYASCL